MVKPDWSTQAARLKWARINAGFKSARSAWMTMDWSRGTYARHEDGTRLEQGLSEEEAQKYARAFSVDWVWLLSGRGHPTKKKAGAQPLISGRIGAGAHIFESEDDGYPLDVDMPQEILDDCEIFEVDGGSMLPFYRDKDIVCVEKRQTSPKDMIGRVCLVRLEDGSRMMKTLQRGSDADLYNLESPNAEVLIDQDVVQCGKIRWVRFA
ncbi:S24 family peptidase [Terrarubrum flagellatum]|uniref:S24 family peptidase n=1 Tax=Terrirubrum flagellatum TaxID=2895980 RepID=UPI0031453BC8